MNQIMSKEDLKAFAVTIKIGLVATIDDLGDPHITVLSTLSGKDEKTLMFGKFVKGTSTDHLLARPKAGFLIMNTAKEFWFGKMDYSHLLKEGEDYIMYNNQPLYRYNTYFGINTVYYLALKEISEKESLPMGQVIGNALLVLLLKNRFKSKDKKEVMKPWAAKFTAKLDTLKFISFIDESGYPQIVPIIQAQSVGSSRIVIKNAPFSDRLSALKEGTKVAILAFSMTMEDILLKGTFQGFCKRGFGYVEIERIYNAMPPIHKYIYPENENKEVLFSAKDPIAQ